MQNQQLKTKKQRNPNKNKAIRAIAQGLSCSYSREDFGFFGFPNEYIINIGRIPRIDTESREEQLQ